MFTAIHNEILAGPPDLPKVLEVLKRNEVTSAAGMIAARIIPDSSTLRELVPVTDVHARALLVRRTTDLGPMLYRPFVHSR